MFQNDLMYGSGQECEGGPHYFAEIDSVGFLDALWPEVMLLLLFSSPN